MSVVAHGPWSQNEKAKRIRGMAVSLDGGFSGQERNRDVTAKKIFANPNRVLPARAGQTRAGPKLKSGSEAHAVVMRFLVTHEATTGHNDDAQHASTLPSPLGPRSDRRRRLLCRSARRSRRQVGKTLHESQHADCTELLLRSCCRHGSARHHCHRCRHRAARADSTSWHPLHSSTVLGATAVRDALVIMTARAGFEPRAC